MHRASRPLAVVAVLGSVAVLLSWSCSKSNNINVAGSDITCKKTNADCTSDAECCAVDGGNADGGGKCLTSTTKSVCAGPCAASTDCADGCCSPIAVGGNTFGCNGLCHSAPADCAACAP